LAASTRRYGLHPWAGLMNFVPTVGDMQLKRFRAAAAQQLCSTKPHEPPLVSLRVKLIWPPTQGFVVDVAVGIPRWHARVRGSNPLSSPRSAAGFALGRSWIARPRQQIGSNHRCAGRSVAHRGAIPAALAGAVSWSDLPTAITPRSGGIRTPTVTVRAHPAPSRIPQLSRGLSGAGKYFGQGSSGTVRGRT
jgi:hypothetical protein